MGRQGRQGAAKQGRQEGGQELEWGSLMTRRKSESEEDSREPSSEDDNRYASGGDVPPLPPDFVARYKGQIPLGH